MEVEGITIGNGVNIKSACCNFYEQDLVRLLLGDSWHPGGLALTKELGKKLGLVPEDKVLDLASGLGVSAICLAEEFGSTITGIDISQKNVDQANATVEEKGLDNVVFRVGDVERLPHKTEEFDVVISECSFCLFPHKEVAAREMWRVLKDSTGRLGITDVAIERKLPFDVKNMIFRVACITDALKMREYGQLFEKIGFKIVSIEDRRDIVLQMIDSIKKRIFLFELVKGIKKINLENIDLKQAKFWLKEGTRLVKDGYGTYMILIGSKI